MIRRLATLAVFPLLAVLARAQEEFRYPPPELGPSYREPVTALPPVREVLAPMGDVLVLAGALALASYLALRRRSRTGLWLLAVASLVYFGFVRQGCICAVGSLQNVAQAIADSGVPILPATILFFALPLVTTLLFGRSFCAAVCPLGAIQEVILVRPTRLPGWLERGLSFLAVLYLALAVLFAVTGSAYIICRYDPFVGFFRFSASANMMIVGACFLVIGLFIGRPYCRFLCPYGVLLGWASKLSWKRVTISPEECVNCHLCEGACPYEAIRAVSPAPGGGDPRRGRGALVAMLLLGPLLVLALGWAGGRLGPVLAAAHPRVDLAEQIAAQEAGLVRESTDASDAFRASGEPIADLMAAAAAKRAQFTSGSRLAGGFVGLILALELIGLSIRRRRPDYQADRARCFACARCYTSCPVELERRGAIAP